MAKCESCGNEYEPSMQITLDGQTFHFDCFECAIEILAPLCKHCGTKILGHGVQAEGEVYCCGHCARAEGHAQIRDSA
jgi:hypothetical protein